MSHRKEYGVTGAKAREGGEQRCGRRGWQKGRAGPGPSI